MTAEEGADLYAEASREAEIVGHLDAGTEAQVILNEDQTWGQIYTEDEEAAAQFICMEDAAIIEEEAEGPTEEELKLMELGYRKVQVLNRNGADIYDSTEEEAAVIGHAEFESELWIKDAEAEGWAEIYTAEEENLQYVKLAEIEEQPLTDEDMLELGYIKVFVAIDIGANIYDSSIAYEGETPVDHLDAGTELWVKLIEGAERAEIFNEDETADARFINLVDIIATLKPEGMEDLPTRAIVVHSTLDEAETVYAGQEVTLEIEFINFLEDDHYNIQWKYRPFEGEEFIDIEDAGDTTYVYSVDAENVYNTWMAYITLITAAEQTSEEQISEEQAPAEQTSAEQV